VSARLRSCSRSKPPATPAAAARVSLRGTARGPRRPVRAGRARAAAARSTRQHVQHAAALRRGARAALQVAHRDRHRAIADAAPAPRRSSAPCASMTSMAGRCCTRWFDVERQVIARSGCARWCAPSSSCPRSSARRCSASASSVRPSVSVASAFARSSATSSAPATCSCTAVLRKPANAGVLHYGSAPRGLAAGSLPTYPSAAPPPAHAPTAQQQHRYRPSSEPRASCRTSVE